MALKAQVIGVGAAGNKGAIKLLSDRVIQNKEDILLVNSTNKDVPNEYMDMFVQIGDKSQLGGCGKEPNIGEKICLEALQNGSLDLDKFIKPDTKIVIIICSTEGGTGSGAAPVIAKYLRQVGGLDVHVFAFLGFEEDARGLLNTLNFFKKLPEDIIVEAIRNKNFLDGRMGNYLKAEERADEELSVRVSIRLGNLIIPSTQNMDDTDLYKVSTQTGYSNVEYREIDENIRNVQHFNDIIKDMIDNTKSLRPDTPSQKLLGIMINLPKKDIDSIDYSFNEITTRYGKPFEKFTHVQSNDGICPFIAFISAGMDLPLDEIKAVYDRYLDATQSVHKDKDEFFSSLEGINSEAEDEMFDMKNKKPDTQKKNDFFSSFNLETPNRPTASKKSETNKEDKMDNF